MTINISGKVDEEMFNKFITFFNENKTVGKTIYFSSSGGSTAIAQACVNLITSNDLTNITLIAYSKLYSSGFDIFYKSKCKKIILKDCIGMYHQGNLEVSVNENLKPVWKEDECKLAYQKICKLKTIEFCKSLNFSNKNLKLIIKGDDVWFQNSELQEMLKHSVSPNV